MQFQNGKTFRNEKDSSYEIKNNYLYKKTGV